MLFRSYFLCPERKWYFPSPFSASTPPIRDSLYLGKTPILNKVRRRVERIHFNFFAFSAFFPLVFSHPGLAWSPRRSPRRRRRRSQRGLLQPDWFLHPGIITARSLAWRPLYFQKCWECGCQAGSGSFDSPSNHPSSSGDRKSTRLNSSH